MKMSPQLEKLEQMLRSSRLSARGFLGDDKRSLWEIIDTDAKELDRLGRTKEEIAARMTEITQKAKEGLGDWVELGEKLRAWASDTRGIIACPWPHAFRADKTVITAERTDTGLNIKWAELNIHLIGEHGFFQGRGSAFRLPPAKLVEIIF